MLQSESNEQINFDLIAYRHIVNIVLQPWFMTRNYYHVDICGYGFTVDEEKFGFHVLPLTLDIDFSFLIKANEFTSALSCLELKESEVNSNIFSLILLTKLPRIYFHSINIWFWPIQWHHINLMLCMNELIKSAERGWRGQFWVSRMNHCLV